MDQTADARRPSPPPADHPATRPRRAARLGVWLLGLAVGLSAPACAGADDRPVAAPADTTPTPTPTASVWPVTAKRPALIRYDGLVTETNRRFLERSVADARRRGADALVLEVDSPGGYLLDALETGEWLAAIDDLPVIVYVPREALSGAAILALGGTDIVVGPDARFGDAGVIEFDSGGLFRYAPEKLRSDAALRVRELALKRGRPPALAEAMVDQDLVVYSVIDPATGARRFVTDHDAPRPDDGTPASEPAEEVSAPGDRAAGLATQETGVADADGAGDDRGEALDGGDGGREMVFETRAGHFFEVTGRRAVELGLARATVEGRPDLAERIGVEAFPLVYRWGWRDTAAVILSSWLVGALLLVIGLIAIKVELSAPGIGAGGVIATLCFVLFFYGRFLGGTAAWLEVLLFLAGLVFLAVELFLIPGFGFVGITGVCLMLAAVLLAFQDFTVPQSAQDWRTLAWAASTIFVVGCVSMVTFLTVGNYLGAGTIVEPLVLRPPSAEDLRPAADLAPFGSGGDLADPAGTLVVGQSGTAGSALRPSGKGIFAGRPVDVITDGDYVDRDAPIEVVEIRGHRIVVRPKG